jgi:hypothetical protein
LAKKSKTIAKSYKKAWAADTRHAKDHGFDVATLMASLNALDEHVKRRMERAGADKLCQPKEADDIEVYINTMKGYNEKMHEVSRVGRAARQRVPCA